MTSAKWVDNFQGIIPEKAGSVILLMGVRVIVGLDDQGKEAFWLSVEGEESDLVKASFMVDLAGDFIRGLARQAFTAFPRGHAT